MWFMGRWIGFGRMVFFLGDYRILHGIESLIKVCRDYIVRSLDIVVRGLGSSIKASSKLIDGKERKTENACELPTGEGRLILELKDH